MKPEKARQLVALAPVDHRDPPRWKPKELNASLRSASDPCGEMHALLSSIVAWARAHPERIGQLEGMEHALGSLRDEDVKLLMNPSRLDQVREIAGILFTLHGARKRLAPIWWFLVDQEGLNDDGQLSRSTLDSEGQTQRVLWYMDRFGLTVAPGSAADLLIQQPGDVIRGVLLRLDQLKYLKDYVASLAEHLVLKGTDAVAEAIAEAVLLDFSPSCQLLLQRIFANKEADKLLRPVVRAARARNSVTSARFENLIEGQHAHDEEQAALFGAYLSAGPADLGEIVELFSTSAVREMPASISIVAWGVSHFRSYSHVSGTYTPLARRDRRGARPPDFNRRLVWTYVGPTDMPRVMASCRGPKAGLMAVTLLGQVLRSGQAGEALVRAGLRDDSIRRHIRACVNAREMGQILSDISDLHLRLTADARDAAYDLFRFAMTTFLPELEVQTLHRLRLPIVEEADEVLATQISAELRRRIATGADLPTISDILEFSHDATACPSPLRGELTPAIWRRSVPARDALPSAWWRWTAALGRIAERSPEVASSCAAAMHAEDFGAWDTQLGSVVLSELVFAPRSAHEGLRGITVMFDQWADVDPPGAMDGLQHLSVVHHPLMCEGVLRQRGSDLVDSESFDDHQDDAPAQWCALLARRWPEVSVELACWFVENAPVLQADQPVAAPLSRAMAFLVRHLPGAATETLIAALVSRSKLIDEADWRRFAVLALIELPAPALDYRKEMLENAIRLKRGNPNSAPFAAFTDWRRANSHRWPELQSLLRSM